MKKQQNFESLKNDCILSSVLSPIALSQKINNYAGALNNLIKNK